MNELERILEIAKKKGIQQKTICELCGFSEQTFSGWKNGNSKSYKKYLPKIAKVLNVSVEYLTTGIEKPETKFYNALMNAEPNIRKAILILLKIEEE